jgi:CdiI immunity protein
MDDRARLQKFFGGLFHSDWKTVADDPDELVRLHTLVEWSPVLRERLAAAIERFAAAHQGDAELERALQDDLGCHFAPRDAGTTARAWLLHVAALLRARRP